MRVCEASILGVAVLLTLASMGCNRSDLQGRKAVCGKVTLGGAPLAKGNIRLEACDSLKQQAGNVVRGHATGARIIDGKFTIPAENGLPPGNYLVRISAAASKERTAGGPPGSSFYAPELIPAEFNVKSKQVIEVKDGVLNEFTFDIPGKK